MSRRESWGRAGRRQAKAIMGPAAAPDPPWPLAAADAAAVERRFAAAAIRDALAGRGGDKARPPH